jgi:enamine deaminase RidA (YjgF/YER057c/UK114 family)
MGDVTQLIVFLIDPEDFPGFNDVYREFFRDPFPNRSTVIVKALLAPGMRIEFVAYAYFGP